MTETTKNELLNQAARDYKALHEAIQGLNEVDTTASTRSTSGPGAPPAASDRIALNLHASA